MASMNNATRKMIIDIASSQGFNVQLKADGTDLYDKNLVFKSRRYPSQVFINRETGISKTSGESSYLKVAVHPGLFRKEVIDPEAGIEDSLNMRTKIGCYYADD